MNNQRNYDVIRRYINAASKNKNFEINFIENNNWSPIIRFVIDVEKMDKNTNKYDESYRAQFISKPRNVLGGVRITIKDWSIKKFINEMLKILSLPPMSFSTDFDFINYEYLEEFEKKINKAIKKTSQPKSSMEFYLDGSNPKTQMVFTNVKNIEGFIAELQENLDIDLTSYSATFKH